MWVYEKIVPDGTCLTTDSNTLVDATLSALFDWEKEETGDHMVNGQFRLRPAGRRIGLAAMAMLIATTVEPTTVLARSSGLASRQMLTHATSSDATDFSARRRYRRHYHGNPAAGLAIMGAMIGTIGAIAAHQHDDDYYYGGPGYYAGPGYYGPPPVYYAPRPYYGHPYYGHPYYGPRVHYYQPY